jgi:hypothetical protein
MYNLYHKFRRFVQRQTIRVFRYIETDYEKSIYENDSISICKTLINHKESTLLLTPRSGKRYIKSETSDVFIILDSHRIKIINHVYAYDIYVTDKPWTKLLDYFDTEVEKRRDEFEKQITSNIQSSLKKILHEVK